MMQNEDAGEEPEEEQYLNGGSGQNHVEMDDNNEEMEEDEIADQEDYEVDQNDANENAEEDGESQVDQDLE